jgi:UDP-2-acetamido-2-deoxy-ribo-hexuluronate aminotransferase
MVTSEPSRFGPASRAGASRTGESDARFLHHFAGLNARMDETTAEFLLRRLITLDDALERRRAIAQHYNDRLGDLSPALVTPVGGFDGRVVYTYVVRAVRRDALREHLDRAGVETVVHVPRPLHLQPAFAAVGHRAGDFPVSERLARECVALPLFPGLRDSEVEYVAAAVRAFYEGAA